MDLSHFMSTSETNITHESCGWFNNLKFEGPVPQLFQTRLQFPRLPVMQLVFFLGSRTWE